MKLYYYDTTPNFGDALNTWLWERLLPGCWDPDDGIRFSGIGTIVNSAMPAAGKWVVFTSGAGYGAAPAHFGSEQWNIIAVRGPLTAAALGLPDRMAVTDGAILLASLDELAPLPEADRSGAVFMPHHTLDTDDTWQEVCRRAGVEYLSPRLDSRTAIQRLRRARIVLADAMHAAIVADALRVPWVSVVGSPQSNTFKWLDWTRSMELPYKPVRLPAPTGAAFVRNSTRWLSGEHHSTPVTDEVAAVDRFRRLSRRGQAAWWPHARRLGKRLQAYTARAAGGRPFKPLLAGRDEERLDRTAAALAAATRETPFLSKDNVFGNRLEILSSRLAQLRVLASGAGAYR